MQMINKPRAFCALTTAALVVASVIAGCAAGMGSGQTKQYKKALGATSTKILPLKPGEQAEF